MKIMWQCTKRLLVSLAGWLFCAPLLVACAKPNVPVSIHGVNYSANDFTYVLVDPINQSNNGGGETIGKFEAGGTVCCYELPRKWHAGMQVEIRSRYWVKVEKKDGDLREIAQNQTVEIPQYSTPAELWVIRSSDGKLDIVASNVQPNHPEWPGKVKGWPEPSLEYKRSKWEIYLTNARAEVKLFEGLLSQYKNAPVAAAKESWDYAVERNSKPPSGFTGYKDPAYIESLIREDSAALLDARKRLQQVLDSRP